MKSDSSMSNDLLIQRRRKRLSNQAPSLQSTRKGDEEVAAVSVETTPLLPIVRPKLKRNRNSVAKSSLPKIRNSKALYGNILNELDQTDVIPNKWYRDQLQRKQYNPLEYLEQSECATRFRKYTSSENICRKSNVETIPREHNNKKNLSQQKKFDAESNTSLSNICEPTEKSGLILNRISEQSYNSIISYDKPLVEGIASSTECPHYQSQSLTDKIYHCIYTPPTRRQSPSQTHTYKPYRHYMKVLEMESINNNRGDSRINEIRGNSNGRSPILSASRARQKKVVTKIKLWAVTVCAFALIVGVISIAFIQNNEEDDEAQSISKLDKTHQRNLSVKQTNNPTNLTSFIEVDESTMEQYRLEFDEWTKHHTKKYESKEVREKRFKIWVSNHLR